ncbi:hypothetical protein KI387_026422, partial [Taxus chinensis]
MAENKKKNRLSLHFTRFGTVGTKVRERREPADSAETGDFCLGQLGQRNAEDANRPIRKQEQSISD